MSPREGVIDSQHHRDHKWPNPAITPERVIMNAVKKTRCRGAAAMASQIPILSSKSGRGRRKGVVSGRVQVSIPAGVCAVLAMAWQLVFRGKSTKCETRSFNY